MNHLPQHFTNDALRDMDVMYSNRQPNDFLSNAFLTEEGLQQALQALEALRQDIIYQSSTPSITQSEQARTYQQPPAQLEPPQQTHLPLRTEYASYAGSHMAISRDVYRTNRSSRTSTTRPHAHFHEINTNPVRGNSGNNVNKQRVSGRALSVEQGYHAQSSRQ